ncbi:hypothetical protein BJX62DRAFT_188010 [Aspergillus germanicus]
MLMLYHVCYMPLMDFSCHANENAGKRLPKLQYIVLRFFELLSACSRHCNFFRVLLHVTYVGLGPEIVAGTCYNRRELIGAWASACIKPINLCLIHVVSECSVYSGLHVPSSLTPTSGLLALSQ